ncbi:hypothetical protein GCM10010112_53630 [Actinoplanes lobatus]|uniref:Uncharacterized protein n=1 Tax=Actinoplanes lobatus TaxID=113568 RepID=A0A7W7HBE1_9ACTN|nr:hypothetical protein [Actinoplanes lobatus]MBB4747353.1 hypothetical protein [Actinoplanes lobatus]GGN79226.1 hypothetical protein GCM10010112_53630 [Actinoplanes lobatus]GIE42676.1 hypothetical protein Alo02nite_55740 [Actinoplanes lobatus]
MPTRVLLEGPAIEPLLAQIRDEYGSAVRIISADKVRSGGIGGFFAKQHFELSVEVPDPNEDSEDMAQQPVADTGTPSFERLLEQAEAQDRVNTERAAVPDPPARQEGRQAGMGDTGAAFAELMAGLDVAGHLGEGRAPGSPRSAKPRHAEAGEDKPAAVRPFRPAPAELPAMPNFGEWPTGRDRESAEPRGTMTPIRAAAAAPRAVAPGAAAAVSPVRTPEPAPPQAAFGPVPAPMRSAAEVYGLEESMPLSPVPASPGPVAAPVAVDRGELDAVQRNLMSVGMPESMARKITGGDTYAGVLSVLAARPAAPGIPDGGGEILVLAGEVHTAVPIAKQLLDQVHVDQTHLLLAAPSTAGTGLHSSRLISSHNAARARAEKLQSSDNPWVVVIDAPVGGTDAFWVNDMCEALGATALWAVVDATRKTADTARHLRGLGEVEALVVHGVELTSDPGSVLGLDVPIFSLDGKPATPHAWAALLCARIAADVTPSAAQRRLTRSGRR